MENNKTPSIRFKGFIDPWEQRKFSDVIDIGSGMDYKYLGEGNIPVYGTGGYMLSVNKALSYDKDAIGIGRKGTIDKPYILRAPFWTVDTLFYCIPKEHNNLDFINCIFQNVDWKKKDESTGVPSLSKVIINNVETAIPTFDEQQKIGAYFSELDNLITLHQRKYDKLQNIKKSMLEKMFPKNGSNVPEIRFSGFTDPWEQRKLGDVIEKLTGGASIAPDDYVDVGYRTIPKGAVNSSGVADMSGCKNVSEIFFKKNISSKTSSGELVTSLRDLVPTAPNMGRIVRICGKTEDFLMPQGVYSIIVKEKNSEDFLIAYSNSPEYRKIIMAEKNGSTQVHIRNGEFLNIDIPLPPYEEQMKIGEYFKTLDNLITLHQRELEKLQNIKKSMLEKMFV